MIMFTTMNNEYDDNPVGIYDGYLHLANNENTLFALYTPIEGLFILPDYI